MHLAAVLSEKTYCFPTNRHRLNVIHFTTKVRPTHKEIFMAIVAVKARLLEATPDASVVFARATSTPTA